MGKKARNQRLREAGAWYREQNFNEDSHIVKAYRKRFDVSRISAMKELCMLGVLSPEKQKTYEEYLQKRREKFSRKKPGKEFNPDQDDYFSFIAGYTSGGAPYGITWEQEEKIREGEAEEDTDVILSINPEDLPF